MKNSGLARTEIFMIFISACFLGLATLFFAPLLVRNKLFLFGLPFAAIVALVMVMNIRAMFIIILMTRALLDPIFDKTKIGGVVGIGGVLNLFVILMVILLVSRQPQTLKKNRYVGAWMIFLAAAGFAVFYSPWRGQALKLFLNLSTYAAVFTVPFYIVKNEADKKFWIKLILLSSFVPLAFAYLGLIIKHPMLYSSGRLTGTFTHANILAFYLVLMITIVLYILKTGIFKISVMQRFLLWGYAANLLFILVMTQTRSAWLSCAALFLTYSFLKERKMLLICFIGIVGMLLLPPVQARLQDLSQGTGKTQSRREKLNSMAWRLELWKSSLPSIAHKPLLGHGLGTFQEASISFFRLANWEGAPAHNVYLELLFEAGMAGLLAYLMIYIQLLKTLFRRIRRTLGSASVEAAIVFSYVIGYMLVCISDNALYYLGFNWYFWFFIGVIIRSTFFTPTENILAGAESGA